MLQRLALLCWQVKLLDPALRDERLSDNATFGTVRLGGESCALSLQHWGHMAALYS
jgi:hypothetical protein